MEFYTSDSTTLAEALALVSRLTRIIEKQNHTIRELLARLEAKP